MKRILIILLRSKLMDLRLCLASLVLSGGLAACQVENTPPDLLNESRNTTGAMDFLYTKEEEPSFEFGEASEVHMVVEYDFDGKNKNRPLKARLLKGFEMQLPDGTRQSVPAGTILVYPPQVSENSAITPL